MKRIMIGIAAVTLASPFFATGLKAQETSRNALDSLRARIEEVSRQQQEALRRITESREAELESLRSALEAERGRISDAQRALVEAERALISAQGGTGRPEPELARVLRLQSAVIPSGTTSTTRTLSLMLNANAIVGADLVTLNPGLARYFEVESGVLVAEVTESSPAASSGLLPGDVITEIGGRRISEVGEVRTAVAEFHGRQQGSPDTSVSGSLSTLVEGVEQRRRQGEQEADGSEPSLFGPPGSTGTNLFGALDSQERQVIEQVRAERSFALYSSLLAGPIPLTIIREGAELEIIFEP